MTPEELTRYRRQISLAGFGLERQEKVMASRVGVIGAGGLGSPALLYLAAAGVGEIVLIDDDTVDLSNLQRQVIHTSASVGVPKAESAARAMRELNPHVKVTVLNKRLTWPSALEDFEGCDVIMDGADNFDTRHIASAVAAHLGVPHVWGSILGFEAQMSVFWAGHGPVYEDLFASPPPPGAVPSCSQAGVLGPLVGVVGATMAMETLKLLSGIGSPLVGQLGYYDSLTGQWEYIPVTGQPEVTEKVLSSDPPAQEPALAVPTVSEIPSGATLIDVREPHEYSGFAIDGAENIPLAQVLEWTALPPSLTETSGPVLVYCAGGVRSAQAVAAMQTLGATDVVSLRGGIDAWMESR